jgi:hypothetical protein
MLVLNVHCTVLADVRRYGVIQHCLLQHSTSNTLADHKAVNVIMSGFS